MFVVELRSRRNFKLTELVANSEMRTRLAIVCRWNLSIPQTEKTGSMHESRSSRCFDVFCHMWGGWTSLSSLEILRFSASKQLAIHATASGVSTWPSRLWDQQRYLEILILFFRIFCGVGLAEVIVLKCRWVPCSPNKNTLSQVFGAWWNMKTWRHAGSERHSCAGTKLGYMKAPKNTTLAKYLNISFPPPIRKQKKSTWSLWSVSVFVWQIRLL